MKLTRKIKLPLVISCLLSVGLGMGLSGLLAYAGHRSGLVSVSLLEICLIGGIFASLIGHLFGLPVWWIPINFAFPVMAYAALLFSVPAWAYLLCFITLALVFWNVADDRVPLYLSNRTTWQAIERLCEERDGVFLDIGCGLGGTLFHLSKTYPERQFVGIESAPLPYLFAKTKQLFMGRKNVQIRFDDMWGHTFDGYQTVYAFLSPEPMQRLYEKIADEMGSGGQLISNSFAVPHIEPDQIITLEDSRQTKLLVWNI